MQKWSRVWKWILTNLLLPLIPVAVRILVVYFSKIEMPMWDANDLLYYNFFICLLLLDEIKGRKDAFSSVFRYGLIGLCFADNFVIALVLMGQANEKVLPFSIIAAIICFGSGIIFETIDTVRKTEVKKRG